MPARSTRLFCWQAHRDNYYASAAYVARRSTVYIRSRYLTFPPKYPPGLFPSAALGLLPVAGVEIVALQLPSTELGLQLLGHLLDGSLTRAVPKRRAEFAAGRHAAALALARFGCAASVARGAEGEPIWPPGFVGSISHASGLAVAAVARSETHRAIGIDVEQVVTEEVCNELAASVLVGSERSLLALSLPHLSEAVRFTLGFSVKESLYKCFRPLCGEFFGFEAASIVSCSAATGGHGTLALALGRSLGGVFPRGYGARAQFFSEETRVSTLVLLEV